MTRSSLLLFLLPAAAPILAGDDGESVALSARSVDFQREVRPILAEHCFNCHGPDEGVREAELRLDTPEGLFGDLGGYVAVTPSRPGDSELWSRIGDEVDPMPPADVEKRPTPAELETLRLWIEQGAEWSQHWAFLAPERPVSPEVSQAGWPRNEVDHFVLAQLEAEGIEPSGEAGRAVLLRRASFDLTGLPPTPGEMDTFLADGSPGAYERAVDRLLASPHYGERQAMNWLDLARYADTNGDGYDGSRAMWPWRDWVIRSFNENKPFDEFTVEQIAGDLLPDATREQELATGFLRNHTIFTKPGAAEDEYRYAYVVDRVNTTATVWMGLTMGCVQCHDHKYDPLSQREYYELYAYFNNVDERDVGSGRGNTSPTIVVPDEEQAVALDAVIAQVESLEARLTGANEELDAAQEEWALAQLERLGAPVEWTTLEPAGVLSLGGSSFETLEDGSLLTTGDHPAGDTYHLVAKPGRGTITAIRLEVIPDESLPKAGSGNSEKGTFSLNELKVNLSSTLQADGGDEVRFLRAEDDVDPERAVDADMALDGSSSGWSLVGDEAFEPHEAIFVPEEPLELIDSSVLRIEMDQEYRRLYRNTIGRFRFSVTDDERVLRRRFPVLPGTWHTVGPFPGQDTDEAYETVFEPEKTIAEGIDLEQRFKKIELEKKSLLERKKERDAKKAAEEARAEGAEAGDETPEDRAAGAGAGADEAARGRGARRGSEGPGGEGGPAGKRGGESKGGFGGEGASGAGAKSEGKSGPSAAGAAEAPGPAARSGREDDESDAPKERDGSFDPENFNFAAFGGAADDTERDDDDGPGFGGFGSRRNRDSSKLSWEEQEDWREGHRARIEGKDTAWYWTRTLDADIERDARILFEGPRGLKAWVNGELVFEKPLPKEEEESGRRGGYGGFGGFGGGEAPEEDDDDDFDTRRSRREPAYDHFDVHLVEGENRLVFKVVVSSSSASIRVRTQALGDDVLSYAAEQALYAEWSDVIVDAGEEPHTDLVAASDEHPEACGPMDTFTAAAGDDDVRERDAVDRAATLSERRRKGVQDWYRRWTVAETRAVRDELVQLRRERSRLEAPLPTVMVMNDDEPRDTFILRRGEWSEPTEKVTPGVPAILPPLAQGAPANRLALAEWLVSGEHPLTARVAVNRIWAQYFGAGLVGTTGDFGTRGEAPSHPELLDWLATGFVESGWDVKALHRRIVTSATYRQGGRMRPELADRDLGNRLLARGPRQRLTAEMVRDNALAVSGLLVPEIGGESVKPYQPASVWSSVGGGFGGSRYRRDKGDKLYRRGLYVFWKRGVLFPQFAVFDAPTRQVCTSERLETNTPLQALVVMNDDGFVEAARTLGARMLTEGGTSDASRLILGFRLCTSRLPTEAELSVLLRVLGEQRAVYAEDEKAAEKLVEVGDSKPPEELDVQELAAWTAVGNMLLGLDATIHRG